MRNSFFCCLLLLATGTSAATTVYEAPYGKAELVDTVEATNVVTEISFMTPEIVNIRRYMKGCDVPQHDLDMIEGNTSVWIPYLHSTRGYSLLWDNASPTTYSDNGSVEMSFESAVGYGVDYYFRLGSATDGNEAIRRMRELTGQVPMIPAWGYGYFQSKERYASADENMGVAAAETTATPGPVYNLQGIQMPEGTNLPAGIYIQDNKKFIIK